MSPGPLLLVLLLSLSACKESPRERPRKKPKKSSYEPVHLVGKPDDPVEKKFDEPVIDEKEPNDYPNWAQLLPPGVGARGFINKARTYTKGLQPDRDIFHFDVPGPDKKILWVSLSGVPDIDIFLAVHRKSLERVVVQDANGPGQEEIIVNLTLAPGRYFFKLGERWRGSDFQSNYKKPYILRWKLTDPSPGEEVEPNDHRHEANTIPMGQVMSGYLSSKSDYDLFMIPPNPNHLRIDFSGPKDIPAQIALWEEKAKAPLWKTSIAKNTPFVLRRLRPGKGTHYILISPSNGLYSLKDKYRIKLSIEPESAQMEEEPNDSPKTANSVEGTKGTHEGYLSHPLDKDYLRLKLSDNVLADLTLTPYHRGKMTMCLYTKPPTCLTSTREGEVLSFAHQYLKKGEYLLSFAANGPISTENIYEFKWGSRTAKPGDEQEPNNQPRRANTISPGLPIKAYISVKGDVDYYRFTLPGTLSNPPRISIQLTGGHGINPVIILQDSYGNVVQEDQRGVYSGLRKIRTSIHPNRRYLILVKDKTNNQFNPLSHYELRLEKVSKMGITTRR
ncbi:hypothetical protein KKF84_14530 [Myxococcota bacterium]|nr:hypothetical protein [Myxococcota bacterium]MBU1536538.1 hypothetical protein [Myxococcota bacterium]